MSKEILVVPEENLREVIYVIRNGLEFSMKIPLDPTSKLETLTMDTFIMLKRWCDEEEEYLNGLG